MRRRALWAALPLLAAACTADAPPEWRAEGAHRSRELAVATRGKPGFTLMPGRRTGIRFENRLSWEAAAEQDHLLIGSGVALGDYDGDGLTDVYLAGLQGDNALYRNLGDWTFEDVSETAGVSAPGRRSTGATFADVDGDGQLDLFVTALGGPNALYRNVGGGSFEDITGSSGVASRLGSTSATFADVDGDGDLDLYVAAYKAESAADLLRPYEQAGMDLVAEGPDGPEVAAPYRGHFRMETRGGRQVAVEQADPDRLFLNDGAGRFEPVPWTGGRFVDASGRPLTGDLDDFGLAAAFADVDGDGDPDLYVCNDFDDPDQLWINDGTGVFRAAAPFALRSTSHASMAVDFADVNRDGHLDFFVADMLSPDPARRLAQIPLHAALDKPIGRDARRPQVGRNTLFLGRGDGTWAQIAELAGVDGSEWTWGSVFLDVDLDGYEDLLAVNGHGRDMRDGDAFERISGLRGSITWNEAKSLYPDLPTANVAFRNNGDLTFTKVGSDWGFAVGPDISHGIALGDLDGDGDLDAVVNRLNAPAAVLRNDAPAPRVAVRLLGVPPNTQGVGARVRLLRGAATAQEKEVRAGGLYLSGSDPQVAFAAGAGGDPMSLEVKWRNGTVDVLAVEPNRLYEVRETGAPTRVGGVEPPRPLFEDVSALLGHRHADEAFPELARQPLLPYEMSRLGPGITWADTDGDGDPDLIPAAGQSGEQVILQNDLVTFGVIRLGPAPHDRTTILPLRGTDGVALLVGQTSFDSATPDEAMEVPGVVRIAAGSRLQAPAAPVAGGNLSSVGALVQADIDGDGDLDLFVAGRTVPAFYPLPATSRLLVNQGGVLRELRDGGPSPFDAVGMVSGAVFSDIDGDSDPDLVLAVEWGPPRVFENDEGAFRDATAEWGLAGLTGLWRGVTAGDLNGDGLFDLVVTNEGRNTRLRTSLDRPLTLAHGDFDRNGSWDVALARARDAGGERYPLERFERLRAGIPALGGRIATFEAYSRASLAEILGVGADGLFLLEAATLDHTLLLNRGGSFEAIPLPAPAQFAPAHHAGVADVNGDGREDVFVTQNFFPTEGFTPRHDAGRGLVLLGDGAGGLTPLPGAESGVIAYGDQRGAAFADYDGDGRVDLAIAQHGSETKLFHNVGAAPGLRVRLIGPPENPAGIGAAVRVLYESGAGPTREVRSGGGYWSADDPVQVLGLAGPPAAIRVRWPDGSVTEALVPPGTVEGAVEVVARWAPP